MYALEHFAELAKQGVGVSRRDITKGTGELSPFIHAFSTFNRYMGIAKEFVNYCKARSVNKLHKLTYETVSQYLLEKIEKGRTRNTIEANMCAIMAFLRASGRGDLRDQLSNDYQHYKYLAKLGRTIYSFDRPAEVIARTYLRDELAGVIADLQKRTGARIHEVRPLFVMEGKAVVARGKGGRYREINFKGRDEELKEVHSLILRFRKLAHGVDWQEYSHGVYQGHVKAACRSLHDEYCGAHGLRGVFSQDLDKNLKEKGVPKEERELAITKALGHNRRSMARHYTSC
jgi:hypothetical protein